MTRGSLVKGFIIILTKRTHPAIPAQKIQPIIAFEIFMMLIMTGGRIDPFPNTGFVKPFGIQFPTQVAVDIVNN